jgi:hypothetical protein
MAPRLSTVDAVAVRGLNLCHPTEAQIAVCPRVVSCVRQWEQRLPFDSLWEGPDIVHANEFAGTIPNQSNILVVPLDKLRCDRMLSHAQISRSSSATSRSIANS